jgi:hypothetical protein
MRLRLGGGTYCLFLTIFTGPLNGVNGNSQVFQRCRYGNWVIIVSEVTSFIFSIFRCFVRFILRVLYTPLVSRTFSFIVMVSSKLFANSILLSLLIVQESKKDARLVLCWILISWSESKIFLLLTLL